MTATVVEKKTRSHSLSSSSFVPATCQSLSKKNVCKQGRQQEFAHVGSPPKKRTFFFEIANLCTHKKETSCWKIGSGTRIQNYIQKEDLKVSLSTWIEKKESLIKIEGGKGKRRRKEKKHTQVEGAIEIFFYCVETVTSPHRNFPSLLCLGNNFLIYTA